MMFVQLFFEAFEQGKGIGGSAGETGYYLILVQAPNLASVAFQHGIALGNLTVTTDDDLIAAPYRDDGRASELIQSNSPDFKL
jgi:hypothetical protein